MVTLLTFREKYKKLSKLQKVLITNLLGRRRHHRRRSSTSLASFNVSWSLLYVWFNSLTQKMCLFMYA